MDINPRPERIAALRARRIRRNRTNLDNSVEEHIGHCFVLPGAIHQTVEFPSLSMTSMEQCSILKRNSFSGLGISNISNPDTVTPRNKSKSSDNMALIVSSRGITSRCFSIPEFREILEQDTEAMNIVTHSPNKRKNIPMTKFPSDFWSPLTHRTPSKTSYFSPRPYNRRFDIGAVQD